MKVKRVIVNRAGARAYLNSEGVMALLDSQADRVGASLPEGYRIRPAQTGKNRARAVVGTYGIASMLDNQRNNSLLKALGGG